MKNSIIITASLFLFAFVSTAYLLVLGWNNALALDDYGYVSLVEDNGVWGMMRMAYQGWQCRFSTFIVNGLVFLLFGRAKNLIGVTLLMLLLGWSIMGLLFSGINRKHELKIPNHIVILVSILAINVGVVAYLEPATFFWLCALNYTFSIWMTLLLIYALFYCDCNRFLRWGLVTLSSLYISGTAENYTPLVILVLGIVWVVRMLYMKGKTNQQKEVDLMLLVSLMIMGIGFLVMLLGPGNKNRLESLGEDTMALANLSLSQILLKTIKGSAILLLREFSRIHFYLILFPVFYGIGAMYCKERAPKVTIAHGFLVLIAFVLFVVVSVAACVIAIGWYAPPRAYSYMSFIMMGVCAYLGICFGRQYHKNEKTIPTFMMLFAAAGTILFAGMIMRDKPIVEDYHHYVSSRNESIQEKKYNVERGIDSNETAFICYSFGGEWRLNSYSTLRNLVNVCLGKNKRYYEPQMILMESYLSPDANDWRNRDLQNYYHAGFDIICLDSQ